MFCGEDGQVDPNKSCHGCLATAIDHDRPSQHVSQDEDVNIREITIFFGRGLCFRLPLPFQTLRRQTRLRQIQIRAGIIQSTSYLPNTIKFSWRSGPDYY